MIVLNGVKVELNTNDSLQGLLELHGYRNAKVAVAVNGKFVPRVDYVETRVRDGDVIEVLIPMQGG